MDLLLGKPFKIGTDSINLKMAIGRLGRCDKEMSSLGIRLEIKGMETFVGRCKFKEPLRSVNFEHPTTIFAVIRDVMFLAQGKERENVGNATRIEVNLIPAKIRDGCGSALSPLINLGTQHNGRSARTWMKRV